MKRPDRAGIVVSRLRDRKKSRRRGTGDWFVVSLSPAPSWSPAFATERSREDGAREIGLLLVSHRRHRGLPPSRQKEVAKTGHGRSDRKSTRLNSSHVRISYAVF